MGFRCNEDRIFIDCQRSSTVTATRVPPLTLLVSHQTQVAVLAGGKLWRDCLPVAALVTPPGWLEYI